jgi:hypothetical protein
MSAGRPAATSASRAWASRDLAAARFASVVAAAAAVRQDIRVEHHSTLVLLWPLTRAADDWLHAHAGESAQWWADALVVEPRYVEDIVAGAREAGLEVLV